MKKEGSGATGGAGARPADSNSSTSSGKHATCAGLVPAKPADFAIFAAFEIAVLLHMLSFPIVKMWLGLLCMCKFAAYLAAVKPIG